MAMAPYGFKENAHTADWELEVWAPDLPGLLEQSARGMYWLAKVQLQAGPPVKRTLDLSAEDMESMLVRFLEELLYLGEVEKLGFDDFKIRISLARLQAELVGALIVGQDKEIKAVTYHNLSVRHTDRGLEACIVFDV